MTDDAASNEQAESNRAVEENEVTPEHGAADGETIPEESDATAEQAQQKGAEDGDKWLSKGIPLDGMEAELMPRILPLIGSNVEYLTTTANSDKSAIREVKRDLTPDEVDLNQPDEFDFSYLSTENLPAGVQYTPEFDPDWVYPSGSSDGGRQDDTPVQGLEIGVLATNQTIEATVRTVLDAISLYYDDTGQYPRHRIIESASTFNEIATNGVGLVAVFQPAPDDHDGLMEHMEAVQSDGEGAINSNVRTSRRLVQYLGAHLVADDLASLPDDSDIAAITGWETASQIGTLPIVERYAPLGAAKVYDPQIADLDLSEDGVSSVAEASFTPRRLAIETTTELFDTPEAEK
ncbi:hypothetical protein [Haloarcula nitratireducens]|uniref:Uncharacterized protein n=1 Tax=Haloarcula nitratireducens TaxID=2487749 RepID=A0AAW4PGL9_9EURY|nr:hypothetical protein [Halomicroarcula nitratireducens]MBX0296681.1 hypothetical protein [Halomicroarcula nitratireducens]